MITLDLRATYDGEDVVETAKLVQQMKNLGMSDDMINKLLAEHKDKEQENEHID
jgi:DNA-binding transcriptional MerR regulator